jgi:hypothetical protein
MSTSAAKRKNFILKTQCFASILQKVLHIHIQYNTVQYNFQIFTVTVIGLNM